MDYGEKQNTEHASKGPDAGVVFEEYRAKRFTAAPPRVIQWTMRYSGGLVKDEKQATYVLLGFFVLAVIVSSILVFGIDKETEIKAPPGQRIIYPENEPPRLQERF